MRKQILLTSAFAMTVLGLGLSQRYAKQPQLSSTEMENIEALATDEEVDHPVACDPEGEGCALNGHWYEDQLIIWSDGTRG